MGESLQHARETFKQNSEPLPLKARVLHGQHCNSTTSVSKAQLHIASQVSHHASCTITPMLYEREMQLSVMSRLTAVALDDG